MQEVNQTNNEIILPTESLIGYVPCQHNVQIKKDNHAYNVIKKLQNNNVFYNWTYLPMKLGYDKYDEGIAILSRKTINDTDVLLISSVNDYNNWKTRKVLGILTGDKKKEWFYSVHMGWWDDAEEPFAKQWKNLNNHLSNRKITTWIMGDFNSPANVKKQGYDLITDSGWYDSYQLSKENDLGFTVSAAIDGWKDRITQTKAMRIDYIWCNKRIPINNSRVVFDNKNYDIVSDHYGVMICK